METITIYTEATREIEGEVEEGLESLAGYTGHFTAKKRATSDEEIISVDSTTIDGLTITFTITPTLSNVRRGVYMYEFAISQGSVRYIVTQGRLIVKKSLKNWT
jgi:mRNA deadenylase 3'-5' endonuclease subunit Ccr4